MYTNYIVFNHKINEECYADSKILLIRSFFGNTTVEEMTAGHFLYLFGNRHNTEDVNLEEYMMEHKVAVIYWIEYPKNEISTMTFVNSDGDSKIIHIG